jgi:hypothetical protein
MKDTNFPGSVEIFEEYMVRGPSSGLVAQQTRDWVSWAHKFRFVVNFNAC